MRSLGKKLTTTSIHEAAHFVLTKVLRPTDIQIKVSVEHNGSSLGRVCTEDIYGQADITLHDVENYIVTLYAGYIAEILICKTNATLARRGAKSDFDTADELLGYMNLNRTRRNLLKTRVRSRTRRLVRKNSHAILALAKELAQQRSIDGEEADLIVSVAFGEEGAELALESIRQFKASR